MLISSSTITGLPFLNVISNHLLPSSMKWVLAAERHRSFAECSHCLRLLDSKVIAISDRKCFQTLNLEQPQGRKVLPESTFPSVYHWCETASFHVLMNLIGFYCNLSLGWKIVLWFHTVLPTLIKTNKKATWTKNPNNLFSVRLKISTTYRKIIYIL